MNRARPPRWIRAVVERWVGGPHREFVLGDLEEIYAQRQTGTSFALTAYVLLGLRSGLQERAVSAAAGVTGDVRHAARQVRKRPRLHLGGAAVLALGLGMLTVSWGIEYGAFGRGLPVEAPERMVAAALVDTERGESSQAFSVDDLDVLRSDAAALEDAGLWGTARLVLDDADRPPEHVEVLVATPELFDLLEVEPRIGRSFAASDLREGVPRVAVLGHRLWSTRYQADPGMLGRTVRIEGEPTTVVGVLPAGPAFVGEELWIPLRAAGEARRSREWAVLARTLPGTSAAAADASLTGLGRRLTRADELGEAAELRLLPFTRSFLEPGDVTSRFLRVVTLSGWLLFLMAVANVANLHLVRTRQRLRELSVRRALGAGRLRVLRQVLVEVAVGVVLAAAGGSLLGSTLLDLYHARQTSTYAVEIAWQQWGFTPAHLEILGAAALGAFVTISVIVAFASPWGSTAPTLREGRGTSTRLRLARTLVAAEIAAGGALFFLAALMIRSAWNLRTQDWGFADELVMTAHVILPEGDRMLPEERMRVWSELEAGLAGLSGVQEVTLGTQLPVIRYAGRWGAWRAVEVEGREAADIEEIPRHYAAAIAPSYFDTFDAPIVAGRAFTSGDDVSSEPVALVNTAFVKAFFRDADALGARVRVWRAGEPGPWRRIVGVAPHLWMDADENEDPEGVYVPLAQAAPTEVSLAVRVRGDPSAFAEPIRRLVAELLPGVPLTDVRTMPQLIRDRTQTYRRNGPLFIWLGTAALILAVGGLYMVVSYLATIRMDELGIRAALGATRQRLVSRAVLWGVPSLAAGIPAGLALGLWLTRGFQRFMFEVDPWSPGVAAAGYLVLAVTAAAASLVPALRAGRADIVRILGRE